MPDEYNAQSPRRSFLSRFAVGSAVLLAGVPVRLSAQPEPDAASQQPEDEWLRKLHGTYRQYFDATAFNDGFPLYYAFNWAKTMRDTYKATSADVCAVIGLRHFGIGPAFNDALWAKYKLGAFFKVNDPKTKAPSTRNFMNSEAAGDISFPGSSVAKQVESGAVVTVCNLATTILSGMAASAAGLSITPEAAYAEWKAAVLPGCYIVPSGVLAVHRAQKAGNCSYCYAG